MSVTVEEKINEIVVDETNNEVAVTTGVTAAFVRSLTATKQGSFFSVLPNNNTITLIAYSLYAFTINQLFALSTTSGTIDLTIKINGVDVTGLAGITASSVAQEPLATAANVVAVGDKITLLLSSNAVAVDLEFTLKGPAIN